MYTKFEIEIDLKKPTFGDMVQVEEELAHVLRYAAASVAAGRKAFSLTDSNGNRVGVARFSREE